MKILDFLGRSGKEIGLVFIGFYIMGVVLAYTIADKKSFIDVINSLGLFLSSSGAIAVFLSIIQQYHFKKEDQKNATLGAINILQLQICSMLDRYNDIRVEFKSSYDKSDFRPILLDGEINDYINEFNFSTTPYIAQYDPELSIRTYYAAFNYNRFIDGIFRWQRVQNSETDLESIQNYNDRVNQLSEFAVELIDIHNQITELFKQKHPNQIFIAYDINTDDYDEINTY